VVFNQRIMKKDGDARDTHRSRLVLRDSPEERRKLDSRRKRWTTKWVAGELAIARRLLLRTRDAG
jgi:hypothetical protein